MTGSRDNTIRLLRADNLTWDPQKEDFVGDAAATALLSREQRKSYGIEV